MGGNNQSVFLRGRVWVVLSRAAVGNRRRVYRVEKVPSGQITNLGEYVRTHFFTKQYHEVFITPRDAPLAAIQAMQQALAAIHPPMKHPELSEEEFKLFYRAFGGTAGAYLCRGIDWRVGFATLATTSTRGHAKALCKQFEQNGERSVVLEMDVSDCPLYGLPTRLTSLSSDMHPEERVLEKMVVAARPIKPSMKNGADPHQNKINQAFQALAHACVNSYRGQRYCITDALGNHLLSWVKVAEGQGRYVWWHREAHIARVDIELGRVRICVAPELWRGPHPVLTPQESPWGEIA